MGSVPELLLFADYYQIHLFEEGSETDFGGLWTDQAVADHLAVGRDAVAVGTTVNVNIAVTLEVSDHPPVDDSELFDHVVEAGFESASGRLVVMGCTDYEPDAQRIAVPPGSLRVRASRANLDAAAAAGIDSDEDPQTMERLRLQIWPAPPAAIAVKKRWESRHR